MLKKGIKNKRNGSGLKKSITRMNCMKGSEGHRPKKPENWLWVDALLVNLPPTERKEKFTTKGQGG